jgi:hypothetical protein
MRDARYRCASVEPGSGFAPESVRDRCFRDEFAYSHRSHLAICGTSSVEKGQLSHDDRRVNSQLASERDDSFMRANSV